EEAGDDDDQLPTDTGDIQLNATDIEQPIQNDAVTTEEIAPEPAPAEITAEYEAPSEYSGDFPASRSSSPDDDRTDLGEWIQCTPDLHEHLHRELSSYRLSERDQAIARLLIEALDDDGYLRQDFSELAALLEFDTPPSDSEWITALRL